MAIGELVLKQLLDFQLLVVKKQVGFEVLVRWLFSQEKGVPKVAKFAGTGNERRGI